MLRWLLSMLILLLPVHLAAQAPIQHEYPQDPPRPRTSYQEWAGDMITVRQFGAVGNGLHDDTAAIADAADYARAHYLRTGESFEFVFPPGKYLVTAPINLTQWTKRGLSIRGYGATLIGRTNGKPVLDMTGSSWTRVRGLSVYGDPAGRPSIGIQTGRSKTGAAAQQSWVDVMIYGEYSLAGFYMMAGETNVYENFRVFNSFAPPDSKQCFSLILDGVNHFDIRSEFTPTGLARDSFHSFNENLFLQAHIAAPFGCTPVFAANTRRHRWVGSYIASGTGIPGEKSGSPQAVILWSQNANDANTMLDMDVHIETATLRHAFLLAGANRTPVLRGFRLRDHAIEPRDSVLEPEAGITSVSAPDCNIDLGEAVPVARLFGRPDIWRVSGEVALPASASRIWNLAPDRFSGLLLLGLRALHYGDGSELSLRPESRFAETATARLDGARGVARIEIGRHGSFDVSTWCFHDGSGCGASPPGHLPSIIVAPPVGGGLQALASVSAVRLSGAIDNLALPATHEFRPTAGGREYHVGDKLVLAGGEPIGAPLSFIVTAVNNSGEIARMQVNGGGEYTVPPPEPGKLVGGSGQGALAGGLLYGVTSVRVDNAGSGYQEAPLVTIEPSSVCNTCGATGTAMLGVAIPPKPTTTAIGTAQPDETPRKTNADLGSALPPRNDSPCDPGRIASDKTAIYVCVAPNRWKRALLSDW